MKKVLSALLLTLFTVVGISAQTLVQLYPIATVDNITSNGDAVLVPDAKSMATVGVQVTGTYSATLAAQCSVDVPGTVEPANTTWLAVRLTPTNTTTAVTSVTSTGIWTGSVAGCVQFRVVATAYTSGTARVALNLMGAGGGAASAAGVGGGSSDTLEATQQLVLTSLQLIDDAVSGTGLNISKFNGVTPLMGNGATGTGSNRVTLSNDNTVPTGWPTSAKQDLLLAAVDDLETINGGMAADISTLVANLSIDAIHDNAARNNGPQMMAEFDDTSPDAVDEGDAGRLRISANRNLYTSLRDGLGNERGAAVNASNQLTVIDANSATALTSLQLIDDALFADEGAFTYATSKVVAFGAVAESTTDTLADGAIGAPVMTLSRYLRTTPSGYLSGGGVPVTMKSDNTNNDDKTAICTGPCTVYNIVAFNHAATSAFLRCENDTAANTTPGSETASDGEPDFEIPGNTAGAGLVVPLPVGASFSTALTCWLATGEAATDNTDAATDDVTVFFTRVQ